MITLLDINKVKDISKEVLREDGKIRLLPSKMWKKYDWPTFRGFCHVHARYGISTMEQHLFLPTIIKGRHVIEIGAGCGDLGHHLRIHMTDNKQQNWPKVKKEYELMQQPTIKYPDDVEEIDALEAVIKYKPQVVIGSWITTYAPHEMPYGSNPYGVQELKILDLVETFIIIGNIDVHGDKPILKEPHEEIYEDWIVSRAKNQENNRIWIRNKK